jgi:hypothetical protein
VGWHRSAAVKPRMDTCPILGAVTEKSQPVRSQRSGLIQRSVLWGIDRGENATISPDCCIFEGKPGAPLGDLSQVWKSSL